MTPRCPTGNVSAYRKKLNYLLAVVFFVPTVFFGTGCSSVSISADVAPNTQLSSLRSFYVAKASEDDSGIESMIATRLNEMGFEANHGESSQPPSEVDAIVTYTDRWMWDITMC
jgi:hypothetical protein